MSMLEKTDLGEERFMCSLPVFANEILALAVLWFLIRQNIQTVKCTDLQCSERRQTSRGDRCRAARGRNGDLVIARCSLGLRQPTGLPFRGHRGYTSLSFPTMGRLPLPLHASLSEKTSAGRVPGCCHSGTDVVC